MCLCLSSAEATGAQECPNAAVRDSQAYGLQLPDCRAYEQVSPTNKNLTDVQGQGGQVWSSPSGEGVTFFSLLPLPLGLGSGEFTTYVAHRDPAKEDWTYEGLLPPSNPGEGSLGFIINEDLDTSLVYVGPQGPLLAPEAQAGEEDIYVHIQGTDSYRFLGASSAELIFSDATPDGSHILFEDKSKLTPNADEFVGLEKATNLYEWTDNKVILVGVLPGEVPAEGSTAGAGGNAVTEREAGEKPGELPGGATRRFYTHHSLSEDGSRVFFTDVETGRIYMREPEIDETSSVSSGRGPAYWRAATPTGSYVFYTEGKGDERNLYRFNANARTSEALTSGTAHVLGTLGISDDGSIVYFVAEEKLAEGAEAGQPNLYELHIGEEPIFIATLGIADEVNWTSIPTGPGPAQEDTSSRVTPTGEEVLFTSHEELAGYKNPQHIGEIYLYNAVAGDLVCVSCNIGVIPTREAQLTDHSVEGPPSVNAFLTHNLSNGGGRVVFQTAESLVPSATNGQTNVYEWEREGLGSCMSETNAAHGCTDLISTGQSPNESYFGDASADGEDIFFFTRQSLVAQDQDQNSDLYDARVDGGFAAQNKTPTIPCADEEACRGPSSPAQVLATPTSMTVVGSGNLVLPTERPSQVIKSQGKRVTRAQRLNAALKDCRKKRKIRRAKCEATARTQYGVKVHRVEGRR